MNLQQTVSKIKGREVTIEEAKNFAYEQYRTLYAFNREWEKEQKAPINVAYGENLVNALIEGDIDEAVELIKCGDGNIVGFDGDLNQLFEHIRGSLDFMVVSNKTVNKINNKL